MQAGELILIRLQFPLQFSLSCVFTSKYVPKRSETEEAAKCDGVDEFYRLRNCLKLMLK